MYQNDNFYYNPHNDTLTVGDIDSNGSGGYWGNSSYQYISNIADDLNRIVNNIQNPDAVDDDEYFEIMLSADDSYEEHPIKCCHSGYFQFNPGIGELKLYGVIDTCDITKYSGYWYGEYKSLQSCITALESRIAALEAQLS